VHTQVSVQDANCSALVVQPGSALVLQPGSALVLKSFSGLIVSVDEAVENVEVLQLYNGDRAADCSARSDNIQVLRYTRPICPQSAFAAALRWHTSDPLLPTADLLRSQKP